MVLGILSDSHGQAGRVRRALEAFGRAGVDHIVHCGDVGGISVFEEFVSKPFSFVWGNTDEPDAGLRAFLKSVGIREPDAVPLCLDFDGHPIHVFHGHEPQFDERRIEHGKAHYVLHGHTHVKRDERLQNTRIINPGALHRARTYTVATLDLAADALTFMTVE